MRAEVLLEIGKVGLIATYWDSPTCNDTLELHWIEPSNYCMYPDDEVSIDVDKERALLLIEALTKHFKLDEEVNLVGSGSDRDKVSNIGNILHNLSCGMTDEAEQAEFGKYASYCWDLAKRV